MGPRYDQALEPKEAVGRRLFSVPTTREIAILRPLTGNLFREVLQMFLFFNTRTGCGVSLLIIAVIPLSCWPPAADNIL